MSNPEDDNNPPIRRYKLLRTGRRGLLREVVETPEQVIPVEPTQAPEIPADSGELTEPDTEQITGEQEE